MHKSGDNFPARGTRAPARTNDWLVAVLLILVAVLLFRMTDGGSTLLNDPDAAAKPPEARGELLFEERTNINIFRKVRPSVVQITNLSRRRDDETDRGWPVGTGSGFIWNSKYGYVVTCYHLVAGGDEFRVALHNRQQSEAILIGTDPDKDLAVLKIPPHPSLRDVEIGRSSELDVGWKVYAIGNPFGLEHTLSTGIISGLGRELRSAATDALIQDVIQTDADIHPGNSGGPLVDSEGRVIGMNSSEILGIGFAVPIDTINRVVPRLIRYGQIDRAGLGISMIEDHIVQRWLEKQYPDRRGVLFSDILPKSPAEQAGMRPTRFGPNAELIIGDLIVKINGEEIGETKDFLRVLDGRKAGETLTVSVWRDPEVKNLEIKLRQLHPPNDI